MNCAVVSFCRGEKGEGSLEEFFYRFFQYIGEHSLELRHPRKYTKYLKGGMAH